MGEGCREVIFWCVGKPSKILFDLISILSWKELSSSYLPSGRAFSPQIERYPQALGQLPYEGWGSSAF